MENTTELCEKTVVESCPNQSQLTADKKLLQKKNLKYHESLEVNLIWTYQLNLDCAAIAQVIKVCAWTLHPGKINQCCMSRGEKRKQST